VERSLLGVGHGHVGTRAQLLSDGGKRGGKEDDG